MFSEHGAHIVDQKKKEEQEEQEEEEEEEREISKRNMDRK